MTTATLQNNVRLRIFLIIVLSIGIRIARSFASNSVHKATGILAFNYIIYGIIILCTLMPFKASWMVAMIANTCAIVIGGSSVALGTISTVRCLSANHAGCIQHAPGSIIAIVLAAIIVFLDIIQGWSIYLILRFPSFIASATQRIRIIFSWAWPFAWLVNISLIIKSSWIFCVTPHLVIDPTLIILADSNELFLLGGLMVVTLAADFIALLKVKEDLVKWAIYIQIVLTAAGMIMLFVPKSVPTVRSKNAPKEIKTTQPKIEPEVVQTTTNQLKKRQKSRIEDIKF
jgi:hypothetical protein